MGGVRPSRTTRQAYRGHGIRSSCTDLCNLVSVILPIALGYFAPDYLAIVHQRIHDLSRGGTPIQARGFADFLHGFAPWKPQQCFPEFVANSADLGLLLFML